MCYRRGSYTFGAPVPRDTTQQYRSCNDYSRTLLIIITNRIPNVSILRVKSAPSSRYLRAEHNIIVIEL